MKISIKDLKTNLSTLLLSGILIASCGDARDNEAEREYDEFRDYVSTNSTRFENDADMDWDEYDRSWIEYDREYQTHMADVEELRDDLSEESRREYDQMKADYESMRTSYEARAEMERTNTTSGSMSADMYAALNITDTANLKMENVNERNIRSNYTTFVNYVDENGDQFTQKDWNNADEIWVALNQKRNSLKNISNTDQTELTRLESRYKSLQNNAVNNTRNDTGTNKNKKTNKY